MVAYWYRSVVIFGLNVQVVPCSRAIVWCKELCNWRWCVGYRLHLCWIASSGWFFKI